MNTVQRGLMIFSAFCFGFFTCGYMMLNSTVQEVLFQPPRYRFWMNFSLGMLGIGLSAIILWILIDVHERTAYDIQSVLSDE